MSDYKSLPAWKRGMTLAHTVYAAAEVAGLSASEAGKRLRKAAVSVPSLIGEAYLDAGGRDAEEALFLARGRIAELERLLANERELDAIPESERLALLAEIDLLKEDVEELRLARSAGPS
jgi:four helix bundle protein